MRGAARGRAPLPWHPKMVWRPPGKPGAPTKKSLKMFLLGAIFEEKKSGGPPRPPKLALGAPPWKFPFLRPCQSIETPFC